MSLFSSLQIANNALIAQQIGLQVTGNNVANANTPGYIREQVLFEAATTQQSGQLLLGSGVDVAAIVQKTDRYLAERVRGASADLANGEAQEQTYVQLESIVAELGDTDLSTTLGKFFSSIHDVLNQPESLSVRNVAIQQGQRLTDDIRRLDTRVRAVREDLNSRVAGSAADVNRLVDRIADLNVKIVSFEGGGVNRSDAVGLRDQRNETINQLAKLLNVKSYEQEDGSASVYVGGDYLVFQGTSRHVKTAYSYDRGLGIAELRLQDSDSALEISSGEVFGQTTARDAVVGGFLDGLDTLAKTLIFEFNKLFSSGQGLSGYTKATSTAAVADTNAVLDDSAAGLAFSPTHGSFQVQVFNAQTKLTTTTNVTVDLDGLDTDTTLTTLASKLDAINGISAQITADRHLQITSDSANLQFTFVNDTSGALAALGIGTFFSGSTASDIGINSAVKNDPEKFAASLGGIGADTKNGEKLASLLDTKLASQHGLSLANLYDNFVSDTAQAASSSKAVAEGYRVFHSTLDSQLLSISGVSLDEEAVKMITYQRAYQASARFIRTISDLLDTLVNL